MRVKALIIDEKRTVTRYIPKRDEIEGKVFRCDEVVYFIDPDRMILTWERKLGFKRYYSTFYYIRGQSNPLPMPSFHKTEQVVMDTEGKPVLNGHGGYKTTQVFPKIIDNGVPGEELAQLFNPWFYRVIASQTKTLYERMQFYMLIGTTICAAYIAYKFYTLDVDSIAGLKEALAALKLPTPPAVGIDSSVP